MADAHSSRAAAERDLLAVALDPFRDAIKAEMRQAVTEITSAAVTEAYYGQMAYHLGWLDSELQPTDYHPGKLLRPALVLWSTRLAAQLSHADIQTEQKRHRQALIAAVAVELIHNFSLIHDDIEDRDATRHGRPTVWRIWGEAQGINAGDGMFSLAHATLWRILERGATPAHAVKLARILDATCLRLCEGQYMDMAFEGNTTVTPALYLEMIARKTAALMGAATAMGAVIGAAGNASLQARFAAFGEALGIAFQIRDDILGIWEASDTLSKSPAGDVRRRKMTLPVLYALEHATKTEHKRLAAVYYADHEPDAAAVDDVLGILERAARAWSHAQLALYSNAAREALAAIGGDHLDVPAAQALRALVDFVALVATE
jgi:geranylgeranyl diphosphate synthase, type I